MSKLLSRAKSCFEAGQFLWRGRHIDDGNVDMSCMNIGFSIEFCLKYLLELNGIRYSSNHNIYGLVGLLPSGYTTAPWFQSLNTNAIYFADWCVKSRYLDSFSVTSTLMDEAVEIFNQLYKDCAELTSYASSYESEVQKVLVKLNSTVTVKEIMPYLPSVKLEGNMLFEAVKFALKTISKDTV